MASILDYNLPAEFNVEETEKYIQITLPACIPQKIKDEIIKQQLGDKSIMVIKPVPKKRLRYQYIGGNDRAKRIKSVLYTLEHMKDSEGKPLFQAGGHTFPIETLNAKDKPLFGANEHNSRGHSPYRSEISKFQKNVALSCKGLSRIPTELHDGNFAFIVGEERYNCNVIFAEFLSQKICSLRRTDPTICEYVLEVEDPSSNFEAFLSLARGCHVRVSEENIDFFVSVAKELENDELFSQLVDSYFASTEITTSNAVKFLKMKQFTGKADEEIAFIARNFGDIENLSELGIDQLRLTLSHPSLRIPSEDFLYNFICRMISKDKSFSELLEFVVFKFLSDESIQHFINSSSSFIFEYLNPPIWKSLCGRLSEKSMIRSDSYDKQRSRYGDVVIKDEIESSNNEMNSMKNQMEERIDALTRERDNEVQRHRATRREKDNQIESLKAELAKWKPCQRSCKEP